MLQVRAGWADRVGALRLRAFVLAEPDRVGFGVVRRFLRAGAHSPGLRIDLDTLHGLATAARDTDDLLDRLERVPLESLSTAGASPAGLFQTDPLGRGIPDIPPITDRVERALLAMVCGRPGDPARAEVYADWLAEQGRHAEADLLRPPRPAA